MSFYMLFACHNYALGLEKSNIYTNDTSAESYYKEYIVQARN